MVNRVSTWFVGLSLVLAAFASPLAAQSLPAHSASAQTSAAADPLMVDIKGLLDKGGALEISGRWAEALSHYEEALRAHPNNPDLTGRFDLARLHYSLEQRYDDRSFRESVASLRQREAIDLYSDMLGKIGAHYYTEPPWQDLTGRGLR